jgi:hypothetical protein
MQQRLLRAGGAWRAATKPILDIPPWMVRKKLSLIASKGPLSPPQLVVMLGHLS